MAYSRNGEWEGIKAGLTPWWELCPSLGHFSLLSVYLRSVAKFLVPCLWYFWEAGAGQGHTDAWRCARLHWAPASRGWRACCDLPVVAYEPLFVVVTVATMGLHLGSPGLPGHLGPVLTSVADSGSSWQPATCFWAVSMVASPTLSHSWHGCCMEPMSLRT